MDGIRQHGNCFGTWLLCHISKIMIRYIYSGFELELYALHVSQIQAGRDSFILAYYLKTTSLFFSKSVFIFFLSGIRIHLLVLE